MGTIITLISLMLMASEIYASTPDCQTISAMKFTIQEFLNSNPQSIPKIVRLGKESSINNVTQFSMIFDSPSSHRHVLVLSSQNPWYFLPPKAVTSFMDDPWVSLGTRYKGQSFINLFLSRDKLVSRLIKNMAFFAHNTIFRCYNKNCFDIVLF